MYISRILYPVTVLGPGRRLGIWVAGCSRECEGCSNPELWVRHSYQHMSADDLFHLIHHFAKEHQVDGISITGGEPLEQEDLMELLALLEDVCRDVLVYTGYRLEELPAEKRAGLLEHAAVLVDGEYRADLNEAQPLMGSSNQRIHYFRDDVKHRYQTWQSVMGSRIQNFTLQGNSLVSVGIHRKDYAVCLSEAAAQKGLIPLEE